ncbi:MAG TPA: HEAT repeat domain-containing protein, partial [Pyrinomonadaceae bacterium]|nr:HEAT repeat domain-containing protein [Pyrinomonadaceae bacterium]
MATSPSVPDQFEEAEQSPNAFDEVTHRLLTGESTSDRSDAARELGMLGRSEAAAYLIAALYDSSAEVRKAAAGSLGMIGDSDAIRALNDLQERENNGDQPDSIISEAIFAITNRQASRDSSCASQTFTPEDNGFQAAAQLLRNKRHKPVIELQTETRVIVDSVFKEQSDQSKQIETATYRKSGNHKAPESVVHALASEDHIEHEAKHSQVEMESSLRAGIDNEIDAGFEMLRQAEAKQSQLIAEAENRLRAQEEARQQIEAKAQQRAERERRLEADIQALREAEQEQLQRI